MPTGDGLLRADTCGDEPTSSVERRLIIKPVLNGYIVEVGCQTVVFETMDRMLYELRRYLENPSVVEKEYMSKKK